MSTDSAPRVGLFVTCLVDAMRPEIGFAALRLLEEAGCGVEVPPQTCCGQPAWNSGDDLGATSLARQLIAAFERCYYIVAPSGSCAGTIAHYPEFLGKDPVRGPRALALAARTHEVMSFLVDVLGYVPAGRRLEARATYHDSCSGLRELGVHDHSPTGFTTLIPPASALAAPPRPWPDPRLWRVRKAENVGANNGRARCATDSVPD